MDILEHAWTLSNTFGHFRILLILWTLLDTFGHFWTLLDTFRFFRTLLDIFAPLKSYYVIYGRYLGVSRYSSTSNSQIPCNMVSQLSPLHHELLLWSVLISILIQQWEPSKPESGAKLVFNWGLPSLLQFDENFLLPFIFTYIFIFLLPHGVFWSWGVFAHISSAPVIF